MDKSKEGDETKRLHFSTEDNGPLLKELEQVLFDLLIQLIDKT